MRLIRALLPWVLPPLFIIVVGFTAWLTRDYWQPWLPEWDWAASNQHDVHAHHDHADQHDRDEHDHTDGMDEHGHPSDPDELELSERARANLKLKMGVVEAGSYWQKLPIPGEVIEIAGHSDRELNANVTGVILNVFARPGQAIRPGEAMFKLRITDEELIETQSALIQTIQQIKVNQAEMDRIKPLVPDTIPESNLLKLRYEQEKLAVRRDLHEQDLHSHGLDDAQLWQVKSGNAILKELTIRAPALPHPIGKIAAVPSSAFPEEPKVVYTVSSVSVHPGSLVKAGDPLVRFADHGRLLVCGHAFEQETEVIERALREEWPVSVQFVVRQEQPLIRDGLRILRTRNKVAAKSRTVDFFLPLENEVVAQRSGLHGGDYLSWRFKPGQQARLLVPARKWEGVIVLPARAVTNEGPEAFVFAEHEDHLERRSVQVLYRDGREVVIANDGALIPGQRVALNNAYQLNLALQQQHGGGLADPHAGHMH